MLPGLAGLAFSPGQNVGGFIEDRCNPPEIPQVGSTI